MKTLKNILLITILLSSVGFARQAKKIGEEVNGWSITGIHSVLIDSANTGTSVMSDSSQLFQEYGKPKLDPLAPGGFYYIQVAWSKVFSPFSIPDTVAFETKFVSGENFEKARVFMAFQDSKENYVFLGSKEQYIDKNGEWTILKWPMDLVKKYMDSIIRVYVAIQVFRRGLDSVSSIGISVLAKNLKRISQSETILIDWYKDSVTGVSEEEGQTPKEFVLYQNYPNPFNPSTTIRFSIPEKGYVNLTVFNSLGQEVRNLVEGEKSQGTYETRFDALGLPSGLYFYRLQVGSSVETKKMILLR